MSSAWTSWRKAEWRISTGEVYYETRSPVPIDPQMARFAAGPIPTGKPNNSPNNSVAGSPGTTQMVPLVVDGGRFKPQKCDAVGRAGPARDEPPRPLKVATRVRIPLGLLRGLGEHAEIRLHEW